MTLSCTGSDIKSCALPTTSIVRQERHDFLSKVNKMYVNKFQVL